MNSRQRRAERRQLVRLVGQPVLIAGYLVDPMTYRRRRAWFGGFGLFTQRYVGGATRLRTVRSEDGYEQDLSARHVRPMP